jgi:hypothetical protein
LPLLALVGLLATAAPGAEGAESAGDALLQRLAERTEAVLPEGWQARVRWREPDVTIFVMPPVAEGFDLAYRPQEELELVRSLCPAKEDPLWEAIGQGRDIVVVPTVLGKGALRTSCRRLIEEAPAS